MKRREFLVGSLATLAACSSRSDAPKSPAPGPAQEPEAMAKKKSILVLGGTGFIGPHIVEAARARGHTLTLFNRGKTRPGLFPDIEKLQGDRDGKLEALKGRTWDAVVDTSGFVPRIVKQSAELLAPSIHHYIFVSTISVYPSQSKVDADETALPLATLPDPGSEEPKYYGANKALSEQVAEAAMPGRVTNLRSGVIVGPGDYTGRFAHWVTRCADGGEVLAPGDGTTPAQWIDSRDLAAWIVKVIEDGTMGTYNTIGPAKRTPIRELLDACNAASGNKATLAWVPAAFLDKQDVVPWMEMPLWIQNEGAWAGFGTLSNARAMKAGLTFRPVAESIKDTLAFLETVEPDKRDKARSTGIARDKELKVLAEWKASRGK